MATPGSCVVNTHTHVHKHIKHKAQGTWLSHAKRDPDSTTIFHKKGAGRRNKNWMLRSGGLADRRGLRPRLLFKTTPGGKGAGTSKRNWMLRSGGKDDRRGLRPRLLYKTVPGGKGAGTVAFKVRAWDPGVRFRVMGSASGSDQGAGLGFRFGVKLSASD
jgi:hypothetical protein